MYYRGKLEIFDQLPWMYPGLHVYCDCYCMTYPEIINSQLLPIICFNEVVTFLLRYLAFFCLELYNTNDERKMGAYLRFYDTRTSSTLKSHTTVLRTSGVF
uniref:Uncharacterized protein n=1 Tax=Rhizophagus irregularis (strain DAOM 181602 / DAOM 197198 / MUCL 43194) TaxID=747089 RepID=U9UGZ0_RHIID